MGSFMELRIEKGEEKTKFEFRIGKNTIQVYAKNPQVSIEETAFKRYITTIIDGDTEIYISTPRKPKINKETPTSIPYFSLC
jgi:hypothetical protein